MSESPPSFVAPDDPLRLRNCPGCDYSREGLADDAACPECGLRCDPRAIILQDDVGTDTEPIVRKRWRWAGAAITFAFVALFLYFGRVAALPWFAPMLLAAALPAILRWLMMDRQSNPQLWLLPEGFELRATTESARLAKRIVDTLSTYSIPVFLIVIVVAERPHDIIFTSIIVGMAVVVGFLIWGGRQVVKYRQPPLRVRAGDLELKLLPWSAIETVNIRHKRSKRIAILISRPVKLIGRLLITHDVTQIEAPCDELQYLAIHDKLHEWTNGRVSA